MTTTTKPEQALRESIPERSAGNSRNLLVAELERRLDELADAGHALGLLALQSDRYHTDADYRDAVDGMLEALRKAGRL